MKAKNFHLHFSRHLESFLFLFLLFTLFFYYLSPDEQSEADNHPDGL